MADVALYRKYRPQNFDNLVGQTAISKTLLNAIKSGHLSHAYLFCGPRGTGKTSTARLVAKAINCISPDSTGESCNKCEYCRLMTEGRLVDLIEIDAASNRGIDEIRDLREKIKFAPNQAPHKVYIIDEVHMLTTPAFNALLKTLEEPPPHAYFILATTESHKVPDTIISRCQRFDFQRVNEDTIIERLEHIAKHEQVVAEKEALQLIARAAEGGMRNAISLFEQMASDGKLTLETVSAVLGVTGEAALNTLLNALEERDVKAALAEIQTLHQAGHDLYQFNREFLNTLRERMLQAVHKKESVERVLHFMDHFQAASKALRSALIPQLPLEIAVIKSCMAPQSTEKTGWFEGILGTSKKTKEEGKGAPPAEAKGVSREKSSSVNMAVEDLEPIPEEAPAPESAEKPSPPETNSIDSSNGPSKSALSLTLQSIEQQMPRILEQINPASLRQSFKTGVVASVNGDQVCVEFQSKFHFEKVKTPTGLSKIQDAFAQIFGQKILIKCDMAQAQNMVDATLEIFGGELID